MKGKYFAPGPSICIWKESQLTWLCDFSIGGAVWSHTLQSNLVELLPNHSKSQVNAIFGSIVVAKEYPPGSAIREAINKAYRSSMRLLAIVATALMSPMLVLMCAMQTVILP